MTTVAELRRNVSEGYNLAALVPMDQDTKDMTPLTCAVPVLREAAGVVGVLRAMSIRMGPIMRRMASSGEQYRLWHLVFSPPPENGAVLHDYKFFLHREEPSESTRQFTRNEDGSVYCNTHQRLSPGPGLYCPDGGAE